MKMTTTTPTDVLTVGSTASGSSYWIEGIVKIPKIAKVIIHITVPTHKIVFLPAIFVKTPDKNAVTTVRIPEIKAKEVMRAGILVIEEKIIPE